MNLCLKSKKILVVGGSKGIGEGIVIGFARESCKIINVARSENLLVVIGKKAIEAGAESLSLIHI